MKELKAYSNDFIEQFKALKKNEDFIYRFCKFENYAVKITDKYVVLISAKGHFEIASLSNGCLREYDMVPATSPSVGVQTHYSTMDEAVWAIGVMTKDEEVSYVGKRTNLKVFRVRKNLTQAQIAEIIGVDRQVFAAVESGRCEGRLSFWEALQKTFKLSPDEIWSLMKTDN